MAEINIGLERIPTIGGQVRALILQNIGIIVGVAAMFVMARYAESFDFESLALNDEDQATILESLTHIDKNAESMLPSGF